MRKPRKKRTSYPSLSTQAQKKLMSYIRYNEQPIQGYHVEKVETLEEATHWMPRFDEEAEKSSDHYAITPFHLYGLYRNEYTKQYTIQDNNKQFSQAFLEYKGDFVVVTKRVRAQKRKR